MTHIYIQIIQLLDVHGWLVPGLDTVFGCVWSECTAVCSKKSSSRKRLWEARFDTNLENILWKRSETIGMSRIDDIKGSPLMTNWPRAPSEFAVWVCLTGSLQSLVHGVPSAAIALLSPCSFASAPYPCPADLFLSEIGFACFGGETNFRAAFLHTAIRPRGPIRPF